MKELILLRGLPGAGKSTLAKRVCNQSRLSYLWRKTRHWGLSLKGRVPFVYSRYEITNAIQTRRKRQNQSMGSRS